MRRQVNDYIEKRNLDSVKCESGCLYLYAEHNFGDISSDVRFYGLRDHAWLKRIISVSLELVI